MSNVKKAPFRADIRIPEAIKDRLEERAVLENRSRNAQAAYYLEMGLDGLDARRMAQEIAAIHTKLDAILRHLEKKQATKKPSEEG